MHLKIIPHSLSPSFTTNLTIPIPPSSLIERSSLTGLWLYGCSVMVMGAHDQQILPVFTNLLWVAERWASSRISGAASGLCNPLAGCGNPDWLGRCWSWPTERWTVKLIVMLLDEKADPPLPHPLIAWFISNHSFPVLCVCVRPAGWWPECTWLSHIVCINVSSPVLLSGASQLEPSRFVNQHYISLLYWTKMSYATVSWANQFKGVLRHFWWVPYLWTVHRRAETMRPCVQIGSDSNVLRCSLGADCACILSFVSLSLSPVLSYSCLYPCTVPPLFLFCPCSCSSFFFVFLMSLPVVLRVLTTTSLPSAAPPSPVSPLILPSAAVL